MRKGGCFFLFLRLVQSYFVISHYLYIKIIEKMEAGLLLQAD